jgi:hypothetical protein
MSYSVKAGASDLPEARRGRDQCTTGSLTLDRLEQSNGSVRLDDGLH